jgi:hypothetical protein
MAQPPLQPTALNPNIYVNRSQAEQAIYLELDDDSRFPALSVLITETLDRSAAFPGNRTQPDTTVALSAIEVYPKFAQLQYIVNTGDFILGENGFTSLTTAQTAWGSFNAIQVVTTTTFDGLTATGSNVSALTGQAIPAGIIYGSFTGVAVHSGITMAYNA